jgi:uncharacterized protein (TIGR03437 family)
MGRAFCLLLVVPLAAFTQIRGASELLDNRDGRNDRYAAIGRYRAGSSCTAFWIDTGKAASSPAYAVTAGHCIDLSPTKVYFNRPDNGTVTFRFFRDTPDRQLAVRTRQAVYATMKGHDLAVLELDSTRGALLDAGLKPVELAAAAPARGEAIEVVGAPVTGVPDDESFLRRAACTQRAAADLVEFIWHFWGAWQNTCSDITGGSSGSPVLARATGKVFGVLNTSTAGARYETGGFPCSNGQPCEVSREGVHYLRDTNYTIPTVGLEHCFDESGTFGVTLAGCPLDPGRQLDFATPASTMNASKPWAVTLTGTGLAWYRYKTFAEGKDDCRDPAGYGAPIRLSDRPRIDDVIPRTPGRYWLCVLAGNSEQPDASWQDPRFASVAHVRVDLEPPTIPIPYTFRDEGEALIFDPLFVVPELSNFRYKIGTSSNGSCASSEGYQVYRRFQVRIPRTADLERFCLIGEDDAGNATPPLEIPLRGVQPLPEGVCNGASLRAVGPGPVALGAYVTVYGSGFGEAATVRLTDRNGIVWAPKVLYTGGGQVNALLPPDAAPGLAQFEVTGKDGRGSVPVTLALAAPGIFTLSQSGSGTPIGEANWYLADGRQRAQAALTSPLELPRPGERLRLLVLTTGLLRANSATMSLGGVALEDVTITSLSSLQGVEAVTGFLPAGFRLFGFLPLEVAAGGVRSNATTVRIRSP